MRRRTFLVAVGAGVGLSGCLSRAGGTDPPSTATTGKGDTRTPMRQTADGLTATFRVVDSHAPTDDAASATFEGGTVTVTGTMDPSGCNRPALAGLRYSTTDGVVHLAVGGESPYGESPTVECGNASYDYRCVLTASRGDPEAVEVVHDYEGKDDRSFTIVR